MERESLDQYAAFDFFVTADHLPDWICPGRKSENQRRSLRSADWRLLVCLQHANGLKHFEARRATHDSVRGTEFHEGPFSDDFSMDLVDFWEGKLGSLPEASSESSAPPDGRSADSLPK
jgi:hypothetical protein